jgi:hypothetical protein
VFAVYFYIFFFYSTNFYLDSNYFFYLLSLNDWWLNLFFVFCTILCIIALPYTAKNITYIYLFLIKQIFKQSLLISSLKTLIPALMVGTISIHPFLFYLLIVFILKIFYFNKSLFILKIILFSYYFFIRLGFLTLFLGGLWGLQSLTWGYIWANDRIEWLLFFFIINILVYLHKIFNSYFFYYLKSFLLFVNYLIFLRISLFGSRHSFLANYSSKLYIYFFILTSILYINSIYKVKCIGFKVSTFVNISWLIFIFIDVGILFDMLLRSLTVVFVSYFFFRIFYFRKKLIHFFIFFFICCWFSFFNIFFIFLKNIYIKSNQFVVYADQVYSVLSLIKLNTLKHKLLEFINFNLSLQVGYIFFLPSKFIISKFIHLPLILIFIFLFFIKMVELRLLYKKKTYI